MCSRSKGDKVLGCPKKLASLIRAGDYDPSKAQSMTTADVKSVCEAADIPFQANSSKVWIVTFIEAITTIIFNPCTFSHRCSFIWKPYIHMCYKVKVSAIYLKRLLRALEETSSRTVTTR